MYILECITQKKVYFHKNSSRRNTTTYWRLIYQGKLVPSKCQKEAVFSRVSASEILMTPAPAASGVRWGTWGAYLLIHSLRGAPRSVWVQPIIVYVRNGKMRAIVTKCIPGWIAAVVTPSYLSEAPHLRASLTYHQIR